MKAVAYSIKPCEKELLIKANEKKHEITLISNRLSEETISYAEGKDAVVVFSCDDVSATIIRKLKALGVKYIATRSTGTDHIDIPEANGLGIKVANISAYSPESIAEHAMTLILALSRNILLAHKQMLEYNFVLDNLVGNTIRNKTVGIVGFGQTGKALAQILRGFGANLLVTEIRNVESDCHACGAKQVSFDELLQNSDIISFHVPLTPETEYMVNAESINKMKDGVMLINVSRGKVFNTKDILEALHQNKISKIGMDVYEHEHNVFFFDHSRQPINDPMLKALIQHSRVLITPHQAFLTKEALQVIAERTIKNLDLWASGKCVDEACCCTKNCGTDTFSIAV